MAKRRTPSSKLTWIVTIAIPLITFGTGMLVNAFFIAKDIATIPYVDAKDADNRRYADDHIAQALKSANDHSDLNRAEIMTEIKSQSADIRAVSAKTEIVLDNLKLIQSQQAFDRVIPLRKGEVK